MAWDKLLTKKKQEEIRKQLSHISRKQANILISQLEKLFLPDIKQRIDDRKYFMGTEGKSVDYLDAARDYLIDYLDHDPARGFMDTYLHLVPAGESNIATTKDKARETYQCPQGLNGIVQMEEMFYEIERDKELMSQSEHRDVGEKAAEADFLNRHQKQWATGRRIAIELLVCPYRKHCKTGEGLLKNAKEFVTEYNKQYHADPEHTTGTKRQPTKP